MIAALLAVLSACSADEISSLVNGIQPRTVVVSAAAQSVQVDDTLRLTATPRDSAGKALPSSPLSKAVWAQTGGTGIVLIDADGLVHGNSPGPVEITATILDVRGSISLAVTNIPSDSVAFSSNGLGGPVGYRSTMLVQTFAKGKPVTTRGRQFVWSVSDPSIVRILPDTTIAWARSIELTAPGKADVIVAVEGKTARTSVNVLKP